MGLLALKPGQHNWWRGDHVSVYDEGARKQIIELGDLIDKTKALDLWEKACSTQWEKPPVWVHGDFAIGNTDFLPLLILEAQRQVIRPATL